MSDKDASDEKPAKKKGKLGKIIVMAVGVIVLLGGGVGAGDLALAHVGHVEQAGVFAGPAVLGQDALILDRHVIAAEAHHPGPQGAVRGVQGRGLQGLIGHGSGFHGRVLWRSSAVLAPPLS